MQEQESKLLPDEEVLRLSLKDPSYFSLLVDKYQAAFLRKCLGVVRSKEEAEDIVQETFVKIYRYENKFKKEEGVEFKSWAYKILMNTSFTHYQKLKKVGGNTEFLDPLLYEDDGKFAEHSDIATIQDAKAAVALVIHKMPEHLGRVLKLYYLEDKSYADICKVEKISTPTLKMRLFRAKRLFRRMSDDGTEV